MNVKAAYRARLENWTGWASKPRRRHWKKLDTYTIKVGYPDHPRDYSKLTITDEDLVGNVHRAGAADWEFQDW